MTKKKTLLYILSIWFVIQSFNIFAQEKKTTLQTADNKQRADQQGYNPNSINPIHEYDIMWKKRIWRKIDLREKQNKPLFSCNQEITKFIIEGVKKGLLTPYIDDSLNKKMPKKQFLTNLKLPDLGGGLSKNEKTLGFTDPSKDSDWEEKTTKTQKNQSEYFFPNEVAILELMEDLIFNKKMSCMIHDLLAVKLIIPAEKFETGLYKEIGTFKYKDLAAYFDNDPKKFIWVNPHNSAEHRKLTEAFSLRLFGSRIIKIENSDNLNIEDIYPSPLIASQWLEIELMEKEHNLWEY